jgi:hypothetical protein
MSLPVEAVVFLTAIVWPSQSCYSKEFQHLYYHAQGAIVVQTLVINSTQDIT